MSKKAVVLLNMGGPSNLDEVPLFLSNMFNDENILGIKPTLLRKFVANMIVKRRKKIAQENYSKIGGKSPLKDLTDSLIDRLRLKEPSLHFEYAMRYVPPFARSCIGNLKRDGVEEVVLFSMYPHYSKTTSKSSIDDFIQACKAANYSPSFKVVDRYFDHLGYNLAIISRIKEALGSKDESEFTLLISAHGLPQKVVDKGDPYQKEIKENIKVLEELLVKEGINFKNIDLAYQSKVGPLKWLEPSLDDALKKYKNKKVLIYPISFTIDNSETIYELHKEYKEIAEQIGVEEFLVSACLNDKEEFAEAILELSN
ncbi:MAG: ferrochelatase [Campylobacterales bacterium]